MGRGLAVQQIIMQIEEQLDSVSVPACLPGKIDPDPGPVAAA